MSLESQLRAASVLMLCTPPRKSTAAVRNLVRLRGGPSENEPPFIEHLLSTANQVMKPTVCLNQRCQQAFLPSEYNRDGDAYRCPWCNKYSSNGFSFSKRLSDEGKALRGLERKLIERFREYSRLYFGDEAITNCYVWSNDGTIDDIGVAVLIANEADASDASYGRSVWNSSHVFTIRIDPRDRRTVYRSSTTVYVDVGAGSCRFSGFIDRKPPSFHAPVVVDLLDHVPAIGNHVQSVENKLRDDIANLHFSKAAQVTSALRSYKVTRKAAMENPMTRTPAPPPPMPAPTGPVAPPPQQTSVVTRTVVPPPPPPKLVQETPPPPRHQEEAEEQPEEGVDEDAAEEAVEDEIVEVAEDEVTLLQVLESLELENVDEVAALLAAAGVNTVAELLECDDDYLKRSAGLPKPARKAISQWIAWQYEGGEEEEG